jgi:ABC-type Mn2+/Zn2+ transport system permease subunit
VATLVGVALLSVRPSRVALPSEGAIGIGYALASTLAILLVARAPGGEADSLLLLYGNILAVPPYHILLLAITCPVLLAVHALFQKEFMMVSYSPITAQAAGVAVRRWSLLLYLTLGIGISSGIHVAGSLLTFSYLVLPPLSAIMIATRAWQVAPYSALFALVGSVAGLYGSVLWDLPTGPTIVAALVAEAGIAWLAARLRW